MKIKWRWTKMIKSKQPIKAINARKASRKARRKTETPEDD